MKQLKHVVYFPKHISLGQMVMYTSLLTSHDTTYILNLPSHWVFDAFTSFKTILKISDEQLIIQSVVDNNAIDISVTNDLAKIFSPYYTTDTVHLFGRDIKIDHKPKTHIGLAMANRPEQVSQIYSGANVGNEFPFSRYATQEQYNKIINIILKSGNDLSTFHTDRYSLEDKVNSLLQCRLVIGYEGGIAHLCHVLKIPFIMLPWSADGDGEPKLSYSEDFLHLDKRTWFLKSTEEISNCSISDIENYSSILNQELGNNYWLSGHADPDLFRRFYYNNMFSQNVNNIISQTQPARIPGGML